MRIRPRHVDLFVTECTTRLPFRFGMTTMTAAPLLTARVAVDIEGGGGGAGYSADLLVPKWFEKDPAKTTSEDQAALLSSAREAGEALVSAGGPATPFAHWWRTYRDRTGGHAAAPADGLVAGFGVALVERAMLDAVCRARGESFQALLHGDSFGFAPGEVFPELADWRPARALERTPAGSIGLRHTVGLADALRTADVPAAARVDDGLPESLEEDLARHDLRYLKVKVGGQPDEDVARLRAIADLVGAHADVRLGGRMPGLTLDGNEQYTDLDLLDGVLAEVAATEAGARLLSGLLYIEQPLPRAVTFEPGARASLARLAARAPILIDEADYGVAAFPRAVEAGYRGVSVKNCKGVFRALLNRGLCDALTAPPDGVPLFQSAEDLTNLPVLALQQDLATVAALGLPHVERNGHHYFHGLRHLSEREAAAALAAHPDLYAPASPPGGAREASLRVEAGRLSLSSLTVAPGFGTAIPIDLEARRPAGEWRPRTSGSSSAGASAGAPEDGPGSPSAPEPAPERTPAAASEQSPDAGRPDLS